MFFDAIKRNEDGSVRWVNSECEACRRVRTNVRKKPYRRKRMISPAMRTAMRREAERMRKAAARRRNGIEPRNFSSRKRHPSDYIEVYIDAKRFRAWLIEWVAQPGHSLKDLARLADMDDRRLRVIKRGAWKDANGKTYLLKNVSLTVIIRVLEAANEDEKLIEIAPPSAVRSYRWSPDMPAEMREHLGLRQKAS